MSAKKAKGSEAPDVDVALLQLELEVQVIVTALYQELAEQVCRENQELRKVADLAEQVLRENRELRKLLVIRGSRNHA